MRRSIVEKFLLNVNKPNGDQGCWVWVGSKDSRGYGKVYYNKQYYSASRLAFRLTYGPLQENMVVTHTCGNSLCVNAYHMKALTKTPPKKEFAC